MNRSNKTSELSQSLPVGARANETPAKETAAWPIVARATRSAIVSMQSEESFEEVAIDPGRSPEDIAAAREAYGRLSAQEQKVVRMHTEGWTYKEIGVTVGCSKECVRAIYRGAIEQMRRMLK